MRWVKQNTTLLLMCLLFAASCIMAQAAQAPDGTTRQVDISGGTESTAPEPEAEPEPEPPEEGAPTVLLLAGAGVVLAVLAALPAAVLLRKKKPGSGTGASPRPPVPSGRTASSVRTEFLEGGKPAFTIKISDMNDPGRSWVLPVNGEVLIGRESYCQIQLTDSSVSRVQCKILLHNGALTLVNLSSTNLTRRNGSQISDNCPLQLGDVLKLGRESLQVDRIQRLEQYQPAPVPHEDPEKTQSLF